MSSTNVKVKASSAHSETKPAMPKSANSAPASDRADGKNLSKAGVADDGGKAKRAKSADGKPDGPSGKKPSAFDNMVKKFQPYLDKHGHAIVYGIVGFVAAVLILTIGFWPVLLLAIFIAIGIVIGRFRDSGASMQNAARSLVESIRR